jgi:hypothetical protein
MLGRLGSGGSSSDNFGKGGSGTGRAGSTVTNNKGKPNGYELED